MRRTERMSERMKGFVHVDVSMLMYWWCYRGCQCIRGSWWLPWLVDTAVGALPARMMKLGAAAGGVKQ